jgi:radical SAM protein with 4Fe4S-binding SPASM domain
MRTRLRAAVSDGDKQSCPNSLLELWIEVWPFCHLNCSYCFNAGGNAGYSPQLLSPEEYFALLQQFKALGGKAIGIPGNGEPLHARNYGLLADLSRWTHAAGINTYVFTAGDLIDQDKADELWSADVCLLVKCNSFKPAVQDLLVRVGGYMDRRQAGLELLERRGFNRPEFDREGNQTTRLGLVTSVLAENHDELPDMFRWCRRNNVLPDIDTILEECRGVEYSSCHPTLSIDLVRSTLQTLQQIDRAEFGNDWEITPTYVDGRCDRYRYHLYVDCWGNISPCLGANKKGIFLGNIRQGYTLAEAWNSPLMKRIRDRDYGGKCATCAHFKSQVCNSCLGRFANIVDATCVDTTGCWNFRDAVFS